MRTDVGRAATPAGSLLGDASFVAALVVALVVALGFGLVVPVLPLFARAFGVGLFAVTAVVSVFAAVRLASNIYAGALADRVGTRRAVAAGALVVALSSLLTAGAPTYWALVVLRAIGGFGSALFFTAMLSLVVRLVSADQRGRAVGMLQAAFLLGLATGPSVGGMLAEPLGLRWPFVIYAAFCAAAAAVAWRFLPRAGPAPAAQAVEGPEGEPLAVEPDGGRPRGAVALWRSTRRLCDDRAFVAALVMMAASRWAVTGVRFALVPVFGAEVVGAGEAVVGYALTLAAVTHLLVAWPAGKVADTLGRRPLAVPAYLVYAVVTVGLAFTTSVPAFLAVMALYGFATGLSAVVPAAVVGDVVPARGTGVGIGVLNTAGDLGSVLGPIVSGFLAQQAGYGWGFGASAAVLALGALAALTMRETLAERP